MSISIGGINLGEAIINCELRIGVLERVVDRLARYAPPGAVSSADLVQIRAEVIADLQKKYPQAGIATKG